MRLDEDEIDALAQAGAVVLRWIVLALGVVLIARVLVGCGGDQFTVSVFPDAGTPLTSEYDGADKDSGSAESTKPEAASRSVLPAGQDSGDPPHSFDAGAPVRDAGTVDPPPVDAGAPPPPPPVDAGGPPPLALCCLTPCSGSTPAAITCGNGPAWTCAGGSCSDRACAVGAACSWMSVCAGRVEVCP
jgi:hypothetical protein